MHAWCQKYLIHRLGLVHSNGLVLKGLQGGVFINMQCEPARSNNDSMPCVRTLRGAFIS